MWYLLLVFVTGNGVSSQQIPIESEAKCTEKLAVFDNAQLKMTNNWVIGPYVRAICIEGKKGN